MWLQPLSKGASLLAGGLASSVQARPVHPDVQLLADSLPILWKSMIYEASQERKKNREIIAASSFAESVVCSGAAAQRQAQPFAQRTSVNTLKICNWVTLIGRFCIPRVSESANCSWHTSSCAVNESSRSLLGYFCSIIRAAEKAKQELSRGFKKCQLLWWTLLRSLQFASHCPNPSPIQSWLPVLPPSRVSPDRP